VDTDDCSDESGVVGVSALKERIKGRLGDLLPLKYGKSLPTALRDSSGSVPVYGSSGVVGSHSSALTARPVIIVGRKGNVGAVHYSAVPCWPIDTAYFAEPPIDHEPRYYEYLLDSLGLARLDKSTAIPGLSRDDYNAVEVMIHPPEQQAEVVAEIEKQFSRLDEAVANLQRVKANLKRYKASVLKAAVEGRLVETEASIAQRESRSYETGEQLLKRILDGRRLKWVGNGKYKEPVPLDAQNSKSLPDGWTWAAVEMLCDAIVDCPHSTAKFQTHGYPCVDTTWMTTEGLAQERARFVDEATYKERISRLAPKAGDIVFAREGTIGTAVLIPERMAPCLGQRVMLLRSSSDYSNGLMVHVLHSEVVKVQYRSQSLGSTVAHINVGDVKRFAVPVPPASEQARIVAEVDRHLSVIREVEIEVDTNLLRAQALRQATLADKFSTS
jgi:type I restriction enzyme S subunit